MKFWVYSTTDRTCGRCRRTIPGGQVALKLRLQSAPHVGIWRCTGCVGHPPPDVLQAAEAAAADEARGTRSLMERLEAIGRRLAVRRVDFKARQSGETDHE
ncbi:MAG TPA: hypothetical protein VN903_11400 [Polyangia bacterium]|nr:hypothetical protein [Polyangia bacterium]